MTTVTGTLKTPDGAARRGTLTFEPLTPPNNDNGDLIVMQPVVTAVAANGTFSQELKAGDYMVRIPGTRAFKISVPDDDGSYDVTEISVDELQYTPTAGTSTPLATAARSGKVKTIVTEDDPVVPTIEGSNFRFKLRTGAAVLQILNNSTGEYHDLICQNQDSIPVLTVSDEGEE